MTCAACGRSLPPGRVDWCGKSCRAALRRLGSVLAPTAGRGDQLATALEQQRSAAALGLRNLAAEFLPEPAPPR